MLRNLHGPLRHNPVNPRYFTDDTGEAVFLTGSHTWAAMNDMYCLAWEGEQVLAYFPAGGFEGLDLRKAEGTFQVAWLEPATGITHPGKPLVGGARQALSAPFQGPSVLMCYRNRKELPKRHAIYSEKG